MKVELCILACLLLRTNAWFLSRDNIVTSEGEVDPECQRHGNEGRCDFYSCFERRFQCRSRGYMLRFGSHYCNRFENVDNYRHEFNPEGEIFLSTSQQCMTQQLSEQFYEIDRVNCHDLEHDAFQIMGECYINNGFCDIFWDNKEAFSKVFESRDLFDTSSFKIWREIGKLTVECGGQSARNLLSFITAKILGLKK